LWQKILWEMVIKAARW